MNAQTEHKYEDLRHSPVMRFYSLWKWFVFFPMFALYTAFFATLIVLFAPFVGPKQLSYYTARLWAKVSMATAPASISLSGTEHIKEGQSYVVVVNHLSHFDILALYGHLNIDFRWIMKHELRKVPFIGIACAKLGHIFINRSNTAAALASLEQAKHQLFDNQASVLFFPEGTRSVSGQLMPFKKGAFAFAKEMDMPILPITLKGTYDILPPKTLNISPGHINLVIHPPIDLQTIRANDKTELSHMSRDIIASQCD